MDPSKIVKVKVLEPWWCVMVFSCGNTASYWFVFLMDSSLLPTFKSILGFLGWAQDVNPTNSKWEDRPDPTVSQQWGEISPRYMYAQGSDRRIDRRSEVRSFVTDLASAIYTGFRCRLRTCGQGLAAAQAVPSAIQWHLLCRRLSGSVPAGVQTYVEWVHRSLFEREHHSTRAQAKRCSLRPVPPNEWQWLSEEPERKKSDGSCQFLEDAVELMLDVERN
jgi:hypothetical protein